MGFFHGSRWAKKERCHKFVKTPSYLSIEHPSLSRFHAYISYFGSHLARYNRAFVGSACPEIHLQVDAALTHKDGLSTGMVLAMLPLILWLPWARFTLSRLAYQTRPVTHLNRCVRGGEYQAVLQFCPPARRAVRSAEYVGGAACVVDYFDYSPLLISTSVSIDSINWTDGTTGSKLRWLPKC